MGRASSPASLPRIRGSLFNSRSQPRFDNSNLGWWRLREWRGPNRDRWCDRRLNGKPVFIEFVSPKQLNILIPADTLPGPAQLQLISNGLTSATMTVQVQALAPAFFLAADGKHVAATHADNSLVSPPGAKSGTSAKPGETIVLYGTGFGATDPEIPNGKLVTAPAPM